MCRSYESSRWLMVLCLIGTVACGGSSGASGELPDGGGSGTADSGTTTDGGGGDGTGRDGGTATADGGGAGSGEQIDSAGPGVAGSFTKCTYDPGTNAGYSAAQVIYPCETSKGPFAATTLTGGWTNSYPDMSWLFDHLVSHGYVVIAMTPVNNAGDNTQWVNAHTAGIELLQSENARDGAAIKGLVDVSRLQILGFSKGGGGTLLTAANLGSKVKTAQAMAPYLDSSAYLSRLRTITAATALYTGTEDTVAPARTGTVGTPHAVDIYNGLPEVTRLYGEFQGMAHEDWLTNGVDWFGELYPAETLYQDRAKSYITAFMKVYLEDKPTFEKYLSGKEDGWFAAFARDQDVQ